MRIGTIALGLAVSFVTTFAVGPVDAAPPKEKMMKSVQAYFKAWNDAPTERSCGAGGDARD